MMHASIPPILFSDVYVSGIKFNGFLGTYIGNRMQERKATLLVTPRIPNIVFQRNSPSLRSFWKVRVEYL